MIFLDMELATKIDVGVGNGEAPLIADVEDDENFERGARDVRL